MVARWAPSAVSPILTPTDSGPEHDDPQHLTMIGSRPRILFLLGESRSADTEDVTHLVQAEAEAVISGGAFSPMWEHTLRPLGAWCYAIYHRVRDLYLIDDVAAATGLRYISVVSIGKTGRFDAAAVRNVIEHAEPNLMVCAGCEEVYWPLLGRLDLGHELLTTVYGEPVYYSLVTSADRQSVLLHFWHPSQGYYTKGGHHYLFKLFLHAFDAMCRKRLLDC